MRSNVSPSSSLFQLANNQALYCGGVPRTLFSTVPGGAGEVCGRSRRRKSVRKAAASRRLASAAASVPFSAVGRRKPPAPAFAGMKIEKANAGFLTNFEVLDFLRSRGAKTDPMGCLGAVAASECKVYEYLLKTPSCNQTRESIDEFVIRCESFKLTNADKLNMIEECGRRFSKDERGEAHNEDERVEEFLELVNEVLPPPPPKPEETPGTE
ncbi:hypothetical protein GUJ93_ZPchr0012g20944 [Zizania palustris]|uniref:RNA polymerase Rpb4/RPC9 core domain-containing protein n=1 Tax=Zizania palustris TaxID=103762 RepID=A0A8J5WM36_ZIZPA|nr:hypothetical protein GUJ93_ZPchr0012g20944 [Zizania palustris]